MGDSEYDPANAELEDDDVDAEEATHDLEAFDRQYANDFSWEDLEEDEHGNLQPLDQMAEQRAKRRRLLSAAQSAQIRRGMIRYVQLVIDCSVASLAQDFRPTRAAVISHITQTLIREFFDQNPLSQIGIILMRNGVADRLTELSGSPDAHITKIKEVTDVGGAASLQNGLDAAWEALRAVPPYGHREVIVVFAALSTCDPGNIMTTLGQLKAAKVRVSVVGLAAEVFVCKALCAQTGGSYTVALTESHLQSLILELAPPPPARPGTTGQTLVRMGFPARASEAADRVSFVGEGCVLKGGGYVCPRCAALNTELPCTCHVCGLTLISSPHLARSYHHLFPVKPFVEVAAPPGGAAGPPDVPPCFGCLKAFVEQDLVLRCRQCKQHYCVDCDAYVHDSLHNCPGCESMQCPGLVEDADGAEGMAEVIAGGG